MKVVFFIYLFLESKLLNRHTKKNITDVVGFNENSFLVKIKVKKKIK